MRAFASVACAIRTAIPSSVGRSLIWNDSRRYRAILSSYCMHFSHMAFALHRRREHQALSVTDRRRGRGGDFRTIDPNLSSRQKEHERRCPLRQPQMILSMARARASIWSANTCKTRATSGGNSRAIFLIAASCACSSIRTSSAAGVILAALSRETVASHLYGHRFRRSWLALEGPRARRQPETVRPSF